MDVRRRGQKLWMKWGGGGAPESPLIGWLPGVLLNLDGSNIINSGRRLLLSPPSPEAAARRRREGLLSLARWGVLLLSVLLILFVQMPIPVMPSEVVVELGAPPKSAISRQEGGGPLVVQEDGLEEAEEDMGGGISAAAAIHNSGRPFNQPAPSSALASAAGGGSQQQRPPASHYRYPDHDDNQSANQSNSYVVGGDEGTRTALFRQELAKNSGNNPFLEEQKDGEKPTPARQNKCTSTAGAAPVYNGRLQVDGGGEVARQLVPDEPTSAGDRHQPIGVSALAGDDSLNGRRWFRWLAEGSPAPAQIGHGHGNDDESPLAAHLPENSVQAEARRPESSSVPGLPLARPTGADQIMLPNNNNNLIGSALADDDLFLTKESPRSPRGNGLELEPERRRHSARRRRQNSEPEAATLETIYFGGFFPWLTDEEAAGQLRSQRTRSSPMINANQAHQSDQAASPAPARYKARKGSRRKQANASTSTANDGPNTSANANNNTDSHHQLGRFILPAVRLALDHINANSSVLPNYRLEIVPRDTQCNATISLKKFFDMVYEAPKKMLLYGDACRVSTDPIAKASYFFDLIQISYADTDPIYTIENYPNFFRVVPSENALSLARIPFIRHFNWTRVGTIYQNLPRYSLPHSKLLTGLERFNIVIKQSVSLPGSVEGLHNRDLGDELRKLKEKDVRIILGNFDEQWALLLFCEAFREKMTGRKYQWILTGMNEDKLWKHYQLKGSSCSEQELLVAMDGYIVTDITPVTRSQTPTVSGMMAHEYSNEYRRRAKEMNIVIEENKFYGYVYDGIWAIALALHRVDLQLKYYQIMRQANKVQVKPELEGLRSLLDFDYHKPIWVKLIRSALNSTKFHGVTGTVSFQKNERPGLISFSQFQAFRGGSEFIIGSYDALKEYLDLSVGFPIYWRGPTPPIDYTIERVTPFRISRTLFINMSIFALIGIGLAFFFLFVNIKNRNQRFIKMSSPYLNNLIIIGCILTYTSVIILGLDSGLTSEYNFPYICNARAWVLMAGFTFAFGSMFSKTFRVHSIFTNIKLHKKVIKDYKLFLVVFILLTLDISILIVWQYFDPFYRETNNGTSIQSADNEDVIIVPEMEHCQSKRMTIFLSVIYVYKGLLMAFGCFLAWETRHVSIPALNDSKYIGLSVYNVVIMCVFGVGLSLVFKDQQEISYMIISIFILWCSTLTLCLVFLPKIKMEIKLRDLKRNPKGTDYRVRATLKTFKKNYHDDLGLGASCRDAHGNIIHTGRGHAFGTNLNERIKILLEENVKQRSSLKEKTYELEALTFKYRKIQTMILSGQYQQAVQHSNLASRDKEQTGGGAGGGKLKSALAQTQTQAATTGSTTRLVPERVSFSLLKTSPNDKFGIGQMTSASPSADSLALRQAGSFKQKLPAALVSTLGTATTTTTTTSSGAQMATELTGATATDSSASPTKLTTSNTVTTTNTDQCSKEPTDNCCQLDLNKGVHHQQQLVSGERKSVKPTTRRSDCHYSGPPLAKRPTDNHLFTVFSYISSSNNNNNSEQRELSAGERNFNRWSEGPFCTLMLRNSDTSRRHCAPVLDVGDRHDHYEQEETNKRASCPDLANKLKQTVQKSAKLKPTIVKQLSQQQARVNQDKRAGATSKGRLPRTLSMIEYLGLDEFDLIARRHDKLLKGRMLSMRSRPCCYLSSTCASCAADGQHVASADNSLQHSGSQLSCSTCCSLTYDEDDNFEGASSSHHQLYQDDASRSSETSDLTGAHSSTTTSGESSTQGVQCNLSHSSSSQSSSMSIIDNQNGCRCHHQHHHHHQHQQQHHHHHQQQQQHQHRPRQLRGNQKASERSSPSSSVSSSSAFPNPSADAGQVTDTKTTTDDQSLCTSGHLYCAPGSSEAANDAAQIMGRHIVRQVTTEAGGSDEATNDQEFTIKCDVLESL